MKGSLRNLSLRRDLRVRFFSVLLGGAAIAWGLIVLPTSFREGRVEAVSEFIISGYAIKPEVLTKQLSLERFVDTAYCRASLLRNAAITRLRLLEMSSSAGDLPAEQLEALNSAIRRSLACSPADPFLWLVLFWAENHRGGFRSENLKYLRMSYEVGPNEGWIALKRNLVAFQNFENLSSDLSERAIEEFVDLLKAGFYSDAVDIFLGPAWQVRNLILPRLEDVPLKSRRIFASFLRERGHDASIIPGIPPDRRN